MSLFSSLLSSPILKNVESDFAGGVKAVFDAVKADAKSVEALVIKDGGACLLDAINYASTLVGSDADKKAAALTALKAALTQAGTDAESIAESLYNLAIEAGYSYVKNLIANAAVTAVAAS